MAQQNTVLYINLTGNPGADLPIFNVTDGYTEYYINGNGTTSLATYSINPVGTPRLGTKLVFRFIPTFVLDTGSGHAFQIDGNNISANQLLNGFTAKLFWDSIQWIFEFVPNLQDNLAIGTVDTSNIVDLAVTTAKIANDAVTTAKILDQNVTTAKLADDAVTTAKILNLNVTNNKIANADIIGYDKLVAGSVTNTELATMADQTIKGNISGGVASPSDISITTLFDSNAWKIGGNTGTTPGTNFIGTTDNQDLVFKVANTESGRIGWASGNVSFGVSTLASNTTGNQNVALGNQALTSNTTGLSNIGIGDNSLAANIGGIDNVGVGIRTLENTLANRNVAVGTYALQDNDLGNNNVAIGYNAGANIIGGGADNNVAVGYLAGATLNGGNSNTLIGAGADVDSGAAINRIALGVNSVSTADGQFAIPPTITELNFPLNGSNNGSYLISDGNGIATWSIVGIDAVTGDTATINAPAGRFRKDTSGTTFTLTNSYIVANSIILLTPANAAIDATATSWTVLAGVGSATIEFNAAPTADFDMNFIVIN